MEINCRFYKYYEMLDADKRKVYEDLLSKISNGDTKIELDYKVASKDAFEVINAIYYDQPQLFWITGGSLVTNHGDKSTTVEIKTNSLAKNIPENQRLLRLNVKAFLKGLDGLSVIEKERKIHDRLAKNVVYKASDEDQTSFAALVTRKAVCAGYSRAFQILMKEIGVPCFYCRGTAQSKKKPKPESHAWNIIEIDGEFYNMDLTWDDCYDESAPGVVGYSYYNCTDAQISADHTRDELSQKLPSCVDTRYSFANVNNGIKAEIERVFQDGVTLRHVVETEDELKQISRRLYREPKKDKKISFPVKGVELCENSAKIFKTVTNEPGAMSANWEIKTSYTNYNHGYCKLEMRLYFKKSVLSKFKKK